MYQLKNAIRMQKVFESRFGDTAAIFDPAFPHASVLRNMRELVRRRLRVVSGPQYWGEAEVLLLDPLFRVTAEAAKQDQLGEGRVVRKCYHLAAAYSLIANTCAVCEERKIAELLSLSSIQDNPLVQNLLTYMGMDKETRDKIQASKPSDAPKVIWDAISDMFSHMDLEQSTSSDGKDAITPISALYHALELPTSDVTDETVKSLFDSFVRILRQGKGLPLTRDQRKAAMSKWAAFLTNVDILLRQSNELETDCFADAYTALYWAMEYLKIQADYDAFFPASSMRLMSSLWMKSISSRCVTLSKFFYKMSISAAGFDLTISKNVMSETLAFYNRLLDTQTSTYKDFLVKWQETCEHIDSSTEPYAKAAAQGLYDQLKAYVGVKFFLPSKYFSGVYNDLLKDFDANKDTSSVLVDAVGADALTNLNVTKQMIIDQTSAIDKLATMAEQGNALSLLIHYIEKAQDALRIVTISSGDMWSALVSSPDWEDILPLTGKIGDIVAADFKMHSPYAVLTDKYTVTEAVTQSGSLLQSIEWYWTQYLLRPINKFPALRAAAKQRQDVSRIVWPYSVTTPIGDPITNPYMRIPIPAAYTATRASLQTPASITGLLALMAGDSANSMGARDYFLNLATLLARVNIQKDGSLDISANPFGQPVLNSLAGVMQIRVKKQSKDGKWSTLWPSIPTVYGMPVQIMFGRNALLNEEQPVDLNSTTFFASSDSRVATIVLNGWQFMFVLHKWFPKPHPYVSFMMPFAKATYVACPLLDYVKEEFPNLRELLGTVKVSGSKNKLASVVLPELDIDQVDAAVTGLAWDENLAKKPWWVQSSAYYPSMLVLPHILWDFDAQDTSISDEYSQLACLQVRTEWDEYLKTTRIAGFWNSPAIVLDLDDYQDAMTSKDAAPDQDALIVQPEDAEPATPQPSRASAAPVPAAENLAPSPHLPGSSEPDKAAEKAAIETVTSAPIVDNGSVTVPGSTSPEVPLIPDATASISPEAPIAGEPSNDGKDKSNPTDQTTAEPNKDVRFWKKLQDGKIVDVVRSETAPEGYVPATAEEYAAFKSGAPEAAEPAADAPKD